LLNVSPGLRSKSWALRSAQAREMGVDTVLAM
jgi:hypothetical protein